MKSKAPIIEASTRRHWLEVASWIAGIAAATITAIALFVGAAPTTKKTSSVGSSTSSIIIQDSPGATVQADPKSTTSVGLLTVLEDRVGRVRIAAIDAHAPDEMPGLWKSGEDFLAEAHKSLAASNLSAAKEAFDRALDAYHEACVMATLELAKNPQIDACESRASK